MHIHFDPIGGVAGDMFVAALLDAWPALAEGAVGACRSAGLGAEISLEHLGFNDGILAGSRFVVGKAHSSRQSDHEHVHWRDLRQRLAGSALKPEIGECALAIFGHLAKAEADVHGVAVDDATFHEVGAWDSIADIVASAYLIETIGAERWTIGPLPVGSGRVRTAHGDLPVPAPATMRLLEGFVFHDDGRPGERVTPTGAAILKHLQPTLSAGSEPRRLLGSGYGFGQRKLEGMSNVLRATAYQPLSVAAPADEVGVISFEVDDQTSEDLAIGLDHLRGLDDVLDVLQMPAFGKKGRLITALRLLVRRDAVERVTQACFSETTTLGVRWSIEKRATLKRSLIKNDEGLTVKIAHRPGGEVTAKAEADDLGPIIGHRARQEKRQVTERAAITKQKPEAAT